METKPLKRAASAADGEGEKKKKMKVVEGIVQTGSSWLPPYLPNDIVLEVFTRLSIKAAVRTSSGGPCQELCIHQSLLVAYFLMLISVITLESSSFRVIQGMKLYDAPSIIGSLGDGDEFVLTSSVSNDSDSDLDGGGSDSDVYDYIYRDENFEATQVIDGLVCLYNTSTSNVLRHTFHNLQYQIVLSTRMQEDSVIRSLGFDPIEGKYKLFSKRILG